MLASSPVSDSGSPPVDKKSLSSVRESLRGLQVKESKPLPQPVVEEERPQARPEPEKEQDRIIVGIDFGTTHSAVAWAHSSNPKEYEVITNWPGRSGTDCGKVPSDICYTDKPPPSSPPDAARTASPARSDSFTSTLTDASSSPTSAAPAPLDFKWGYQIPPSSPHKISYIKIALDTSQPRPSFVTPKRTRLPKPPVEIVTDYLSALRTHTLLTLSRRLNIPLPLTSIPIDVILTVPAVWSDKARQLTLTAAIRAGLDGNGGGRLRLLTEPEGAAEYALRSLRPSSMKEGDCFTVVDLGGATADLITYEIGSLVPLELREVAVGSGGLCGAVYLDRRFEELVEKRVGRGRMGHREETLMMANWESHVKRVFKDDDVGGDGEGGFEVPVMGLPDDETAGIKDGFLKLSRADIRDIFSPLITQITALISSQLLSVLKSHNAPIGAILLCGGFGSSEYIYERLRIWSGSQIPILQPRNAWTAVVRGAIIRGLQGDVAAVQSRLSRRHYGVVHDSRYEEGVHDPAEKRWHELRCEYVVKNRIRWYIKRGDVTTEARKISFPFYRTIGEEDVKGDTYTLKTELWVCDEEVAPDKRDATVRKLCVMASEPVPVRWFVKMRSEEGRVFYRVDYTLDMCVTGGVVVYEMSIEGRKKEEGGVRKRRRRVGRVEVRYE